MKFINLTVFEAHFYSHHSTLEMVCGIQMQGKESRFTL